jgi:hypothetical protein
MKPYALNKSTHNNSLQVGRHFKIAYGFIEPGPVCSFWIISDCFMC